MRRLLLAFSTAALALSGAAQAQPSSSERPVRAVKPDLTRVEAQARAKAAFARMDANRDGTLDQADRAARRAAMFDRIDTDGNGSISRAEFEARQAKRGGAHKAHMGAMNRGGRDGVAARRDAGPMTEQAFVARALTMFDRADADRNGTVTRAEREEVRETLRQRWQERRAVRQQG